MKLIGVFLVINLSFIFFADSNVGVRQRNKLNTNTTELQNFCNDFHVLNTKIRDAKMKENEAKAQLISLLRNIKKAYYEQKGKDFKETSWRFPLQNYDKKAVGGTNGSGYLPNKYNYFDGNKHLGHPAHDIFIHDRNQDGLDDNTRKPAPILSMTGGVVIDANYNWDKKSDLRGGKYIWIYDPYSNSLFYYAHNNEIFVGIGEIVEPGKIIATVGRTGSNANKPRSPTHLHLMRLKLDEKMKPNPSDFYKELIQLK